MAVATEPTADIGSLLEVREGFRSGRPCLKGTGVTVHTIAAYYVQGMTPEEIHDGFPHTSLASVYAALAYYLANRARIDADYEEDAAWGEKMIAEQSARLGGRVESL